MRWRRSGGGKVSSQNLDDAAKRGKLGDAYLYYKVLSGDAAHPSVSAMNRYVKLGRSAITGITCGPFRDEVSGSLNCGCQAMIATGVAITEMFNDTEHNKEFAEHAEVYARLNGIKESRRVSQNIASGKSTPPVDRQA